MPVHDWTLVEAGILHDFHTAWAPELRRALNGGLLPRGYYALAEQHAGRAIEMPLFLRQDHYIDFPLAPTYDSAYGGMAEIWRDIIEGRQPA